MKQDRRVAPEGEVKTCCQNGGVSGDGVEILIGS